MSLKLSVPSIGCASCIETITKAIHASAIIAGDAPSKSLDIVSQLPETKIRELIAIAGHKVAD